MPVGLKVVRIEGLRELDKALGELAAEIGPTRGRAALRKALRDVAQPIADDTEARMRQRTGALKRSVKVSGKLNRPQAAKHRKESDIEVFVGPSGLPQAITEEFGTSDQAPHPSLRPAWEANKDGALRDFSDALGQRIINTAKRVRRK